jgi:putative ABC transport system substrate-binding protein
MANIRRRQLVAALAMGGMAGLRPAFASAPPAGRFRIVLRYAWNEQEHSENRSDTQYESFYSTLARLGYVEGDNLVVLRQFPAATAREFDQQLAQLRAARIDALLTFTPAQAIAWQQRLPGVSIVAANITDPVAAGIARSLVSPGESITGITQGTEVIARKQVDILRRLVPGLSGIAVVETPERPDLHDDFRRELQIVAEAIREAGLAYREIRDPGQGALDALQTLRKRGFQAVTYWENPSPGLPETFRKHAEMAIRHRVATMGGFDYHVEAGFLASFGEQLGDWGVRLAQQVDRLLRGGKPAELPFIAPSRFHLRVNRRTAVALGLTIPPDVLVMADHVVE